MEANTLAPFSCFSWPTNTKHETNVAQNEKKETDVDIHNLKFLKWMSTSAMHQKTKKIYETDVDIRSYIFLKRMSTFAMHPENIIFL